MIALHQLGQKYPAAKASLRPRNGVVLAYSEFTDHTNPSNFRGVLTNFYVREIAADIISVHERKLGADMSVCMERIYKSVSAKQSIWAIKVSPKKVNRPPIFFVAGHHGNEYAGPHANLHLLDLVLAQLEDLNSPFYQFFNGRQIVFIPLANPGGAVVEEDGLLPSANRIDGVGLSEAGIILDSNVYLTYIGRIQRKAEKIRDYLECFGVPELVFDFHETSSYVDDRRMNRYLFAPFEFTYVERGEATINIACQINRTVIDHAIAVYGDVISDLVICGKPKENFRRIGQRFANFCAYWKLKGARSFLVETPNSEENFHVGDRVFLHVLAVQEFLNELVRRDET